MANGGFWNNGDRLAVFPRYVFGAVLIVTALVFIAVAATLGFQQAWEILTVTRAPFGKDQGFAFALSLLGYVLVPTAIALVITEEVNRFIHKRLTSVPEARTVIKDIVKEAMKERQAEGLK